MPVHLISGGYANTYLIEDGDCIVAVDIGTASAADKTYQYLSRRSIDPAFLMVVTATHFHIDHVAGISTLLRLFPGVRVCFFTMVRDYLNENDRICLFSPATWLKGMVPILAAQANHTGNTAAALLSDKVAIPLPLLRKLLPHQYRAECFLPEGDLLPCLPHWQLIGTPGHTPDSICFYSRSERALISGDTILNMKGSGELNGFCWDANAIRESLQKLSALAIKSIYPGHGKPLHNLDGVHGIAQ